MILLALITGSFLRSLRNQQLLLVFSACLLVVCSGCQGLSPFQKVWQRDAVPAGQLENARHLNSTGLNSLQSGQFDRAKTCFDKALVCNPNDYRVRERLAETLVRQGNTREAISEMIRATEQSHDSRMNVKLGEMLLANGQWLPAVRQAELALDRDPTLASAWTLRGKTHSAKGDYEKALADFHRALGYQPDAPALRLQIAETYQKLDQPMRSLASIEKYLEHFPSDQQPEEGLVAKGVALMQIKQISEAINVLSTASRSPTASAESYVQLGQAQLLAGQVSEARTTLNLARQRFPGESNLVQLVENLQIADRRVAAVAK